MQYSGCMQSCYKLRNRRLHYLTVIQMTFSEIFGALCCKMAEDWEAASSPSRRSCSNQSHLQSDLTSSEKRSKIRGQTVQNMVFRRL